MTSSATWRRIGIGALLALAAIRFLTVAYASLTITKGDFYFSQPPLFARTVNPTLWESPDLSTKAAGDPNEMDYPARTAYIYGPTIYLTLFPTVFLNSYGAIAQCLLAVYIAILFASAVWLKRAVSAGEDPDRLPLVVALGTTLLFYPALHALQGREFEVVIYGATVLALGLLVNRRDAAGAALLAYTAWFKYWPLIFLFYFIGLRRYRAVAAFVVTSAVLLLVTHVTLGLEHFFTPRFIGLITAYFQTFTTSSITVTTPERVDIVQTFCRDFAPNVMSNTSVRWALCAMEIPATRISAQSAFFGLCALIGGIALVCFAGLERRALTPVETKWRTLYEVSLLLMIGSFFIHAHYYYLILLLVPINVLLYRYWPLASRGDGLRLTLLVLAYVLLSAWLLPLSVLDRLVSAPGGAWVLYVNGGAYFSGGMILIALLLREYVGLAFPVRAGHAAWTAARSRA